MSNEWKEVWYVWDGVTKIPSGAVGFVGGANCIEEVVVYTLGEQRRRCIECDGKGKWKENYWFTRVCQTCNGTGWEWKR